MPKFDYAFKICLIGDCSVGKSNLLSRFAKDEFEMVWQLTLARQRERNCPCGKAFGA